MSNLPKGGFFLIEPTKPEDVFTVEDFNDEHKLVADSIKQFVAEKIEPDYAEFEETHSGEIMKKMLVAAGEAGFLGMSIPEQYGGNPVDEICTTIIMEGLGGYSSFVIGHGGQTGIASLPIVFFGTEAQKAKYLPNIVIAKKLSCFCLTEPNAGSDALGAQTRAVLSEDGKYYILNGSKTFISNANIASYFVVYAKIDGEQFTCFIVEAEQSSEGLTVSPGENKMGLRGSSTCSVFFDNVKVPVENVLLGPGQGGTVAMGTLNFGRQKVSAGTVGTSKRAMGEAASYANDRKQFKVPIVSFGQIREKLAEMAVRTYANESMVYRTAGLLEDVLHSVGKDAASAEIINAVDEYAIECSIDKVFGSEQLAFVVDEALQIHGGYGYIAEYKVERLYRDARIVRIFEGTSEINRLVIVNMLTRRAAKGGLPLADAAKAVRNKAAGAAATRVTAEDMVMMAKDVTLYTFGMALDKYDGKQLAKQQMLVSRLADLSIYTYACDSVLARARKYEAKKGAAAAKHMMNMATVFIYSAAEKLKSIARECLCDLAAEGGLAVRLTELDKLTQYRPLNLLALREEIAAKIAEARKYVV